MKRIGRHRGQRRRTLGRADLRDALKRLCLLVPVLILALAMEPSQGRAQVADTGETFVINLRDADISVLAEQVSRITNRTLVVDPTLDSAVTVVSSEPLDRDGVWTLFQSVLRVRGFVAVQSGVVWEVIPEAEARSRGAGATGSSQDFVTRVLPLERLPSAEAVRVLRPLVDPAGYMEAVEDPNAIVITDTQENVDRIIAFARGFDARNDVVAEVIRFRHADAASVGAAIGEVLGEAGTGARISVDPSSNVLLVRGVQSDIDQIRALARDMDVARPTAASAPAETLDTAIHNLKYADAEAVAEIIRATLQGGTDLAAQLELVDADGVALAVPTSPASQVSVQASTATNAVIARGTPRQLAEVSRLVHALDVRGAQVMIEAAIVEVSGDMADRLGAQLGLGRGVPDGRLVATNFGNSGSSLQSVLLALGQSGAGALSTGLSVGVGRDDFGLLVQALSQSSSANLLSTPSVTTMDNKPATIVVGQNVPFRTGSFVTDGNSLTPFTTIERRDVGITMQVLPRVTSDGVVRLEISQEVSSLVNASVQGAADLVTNRRVIETTVQAMSGGTVVLGGLISDDRQSTEQEVPGLADIPVVGELFRSRSAERTRRTLFVFMRPTVLFDPTDVRAAATRSLSRLQAAEAADTQPSGTVPALRQRAVRRLPLEINGLY